MTTPGGAHRIVGMTLLVSAAALLVLAALLYARVIPIAPEGRNIVAAVLFVASMADMVIGLRFLSSSDLA